MLSGLNFDPVDSVENPIDPVVTPVVFDREISDDNSAVVELDHPPAEVDLGVERLPRRERRAPRWMEDYEP